MPRAFRPACLALLAGLALLGAPAVSMAAPQMERYTSRHYALHTDMGEAYAAEALAVLEAAWPQLEAYFGDTPVLIRNQRLPVHVFAEREAWKRFVSKGLRPIPVTWAGVFDGRVASLCRQTSAPFTRALLLHETIHQFHRLACCHDHVQPRDAWYTEGVAEHLCQHTWDGDALRLGVTPSIAGPGHADAALQIMKAPHYDLLSVLRGVQAAAYCERWALARFLSRPSDAKRHAAWMDLRTNLDRGQYAIRVLPDELKRTSELLADLLAWLPTQREPLAAVWDDWSSLDTRGVVGEAQQVSVAHVRAATDEIDCVLHPPTTPDWRAGLVLHYADPLHFTAAYLLGAGGWVVLERSGEAWTTKQRGRRSFDLGKPLHLRARRSGAHVSFEVNGSRVTSAQVPPGAMGVTLQACRARFLDIGWTESAPDVSPALRQR